MATNHSVTRAMLLAAGEGTRLRPLTLDTPKTMLPIGGKPLVGHTVTWLRKHGVTDVGINLHYRGQQIVDYLKDGSAFGVKTTYSHEETLLGTAGGTKRLESLFAGDRLVVVYGDMLTDLDLGKMAAYHVLTGAVATIALFEVADPSQCGIVELDPAGRVLSFVEKPARGTAKGNLANGGVYILEPEVLDSIPRDGYSDFGFHIFPELLRAGRRVSGYKLSPQEYLIDIGSLEKYRQAEADYQAGKVRV